MFLYITMNSSPTRIQGAISVGMTTLHVQVASNVGITQTDFFCLGDVKTYFSIWRV